MFYFNSTKNRYDFTEIIYHDSILESMNTKRKKEADNATTATAATTMFKVVHENIAPINQAPSNSPLT